MYFLKNQAKGCGCGCEVCEVFLAKKKLARGVLRERGLGTYTSPTLII